MLSFGERIQQEWLQIVVLAKPEANRAMSLSEKIMIYFRFFKVFFPLFCDIDSIIDRVLQKRRKSKYVTLNLISWLQDSKILEVQFTSRIWPPICLTRTTKGSSIVSSVRSSNSHPDLLLIHHQHPHFFRSHRSSTLDFHFLSRYSYVKAIKL